MAYAKRTSKPGIAKKHRPQRDSNGRFAAKPGSLKRVSLAELESLTSQFDQNFPEMEGNRSEVLIVVSLVVLAAVAAALFFGIN